jgi:hypothetical protein
MRLTIPSKDIVADLHQPHPPPSDLVPPLIFYSKFEHIFVLNRTLFAQALAFAPHLSLGGLFGMIYEHIWGCFILKDPSSRFLELFQIVDDVAHGDIPRLVALVLGVNKLLVMAKDTDGFRLIAIGKVFFLFINHSIVLQL